MATCDLCGRKIHGKGNNPAPFNGEICCDECNEGLVKPLRSHLKGTMPKTLLVVNPSGVLIYIDVEGEGASLKELQYLVDGYIEVYPKEDDLFVYIVDEEGLLKKREYNQPAKDLFGVDVVGPLVLCPKRLFN